MKNNIADIKDDCFGCMACYNICPQHAIEMKENSEGFKYPVINDDCINCGMCRTVCPYLSGKFENQSKPECYAFMADDEIRIKSSSGGVFSVLAQYFLQNGGYVAGAVYKDDVSIHHIVSDKPEDISKMRGSKYFQSNIDDCYAKIKRLLADDKAVLFTGTPCQVAGLRAYLQKDYANLYCADIVCHGVPSPKVFREYMKEKINDGDEKWLDTNFRDKINGIWSYSATMTTNTTKKAITEPTVNNAFMRAFLNNLILRKTCSHCKFQTMPRQGDITMGDFWGIWNFNKKLNDEKGTSVVLRNNKKGDFLLKILQDNAKVWQSVALQYAVNGNPCLTGSVRPHKDRSLFFELLKQKGVHKAADICLDDKADYLLVNFWDSYYNYGALLTAYAMQELIKSFGYTTKLLDVGYRTNESWFANSFMEDFSKKFLQITSKLNYAQCRELSKLLKGVILGSDQILRPDYIKYNPHKYLLNFVDGDTKKIALSASFGINKEEFLKSANFDENIALAMTSALKSFDYLSCREISGKEIYKDVFGLEADWIFDPVFLIGKEKYDEIIRYSNIDNSDKIVSYVLDDNEEYDKLYHYMAQKENTEIVKMNGANYLVEDWLKSIKECRMLITDSFHGVCFALIFNKPFICIRNKSRGNTRFDTLVEYFELKNGFVYSLEEIYNTDYKQMIDFAAVNQKIALKKANDLEIIKKILDENYSNNASAAENKIKNAEYIESIIKIKPIEKIKLKLKFYRCKIMINLTFGKKRQHYINKKRRLKQKLKNSILQW